LILVVSLNPALDLTYEVETADWAGVNRPHTVHVRPGGKGVNVARTLRALGHQVRLAGLAGGGTGAELEERLAGSGIEVAFTSIGGHTRRTLTVVDQALGQTALFNEPGPAVEAGEYAEFLAGYQVALGDCDAIVLSGSLPGGVAADAYAELIKAARAAPVPVILDTSGPALALGAAAGPTLIKPNLAELEQAAERPLTPDPAGPDATTPHPATPIPGGPVTWTPLITHTSIVTSASDGNAGPTTTGKVRCRSGDIGESSLWLVAAAAGELVRVGARSVVVSLGADGLLAVAGDGRWLARPGERISGNPTGAGDAVVAGLADGLVRGLGWPEQLRQAVALGAATVAAPVAGEFAPAEYDRQHRIAEVADLAGQTARSAR
jgi:tagatose 6-phosphate kinase